MPHLHRRTTLSFSISPFASGRRRGEAQADLTIPHYTNTSLDVNVTINMIGMRRPNVPYISVRKKSGIHVSEENNKVHKKMAVKILDDFDE